MKSYVCLIVVCLLLTATKQQEHQGLQLQKAHQMQLQKGPFIGKYIFDITQQKVQKIKSKLWYFFVDLEPSQDKEWIQTQIQLSVGDKNSQKSKLVNKCDAVKGGVDSCLLTSKQFNYKNQQIHVKIKCKGPCKFKLSADIEQPYELTPNVGLRMDFEDTAYSKLFTLDTSKKNNIEQVRIILKPEGFLEFPAPVSLFLNQDDTVPTKTRHDMKGMTLWDNGLGIFIDAPDCQGFFTILVEGPEKNILTMKVEIIEKQTSFSLQSNLPFFDYLGKQSVRKYKAPVDPEKGVCLQMTTFSGAIKLKNIYDQTDKKIKQEFPQLFRTYGQIEYQLSPQFFKKNKDTYEISKYIIFEVQGVKQSTFVLESFEISPQIFHLLPERVRYVEIPSKNYHQYYIQIVEQDTPLFKRSQFEFIITTQEDKNLKTRFINCHKEHGKQCQLKKSQLSATRLDDSDLIEIAPNTSQSLLHGVQINKFSIPASKFIQVKEKNKIKKYILMLIIENPESSQLLYTLQYINYGKSIYLKEGESKTDRVAIDQSKYYVFTNTNKDIKEVRVHIVQISGRVFMQGYLDDPRKKDLSGQALYDFHNSINFEETNENDTFYIKITGKQNAYYSIQLQLLKENEKNWWNRTHPEGDYNKIIVVEDIPYEFTIPANSKQVFQVHSKSKEFMMDISSTIPVQVCMTEVFTQPPFKPNCQEEEILTKNKIYEVRLEKGLIGNIGVSNTNDKDTKFSIKIAGKDSVKPIDDKDPDKQLKCTIGVLGKITKYNFKKDTQSCYSYFLPDKIDDLEVILDVISDQYEKIDAIVSINSIVRQQVIGAVHLIKKAELQKACGQKKTNCPIKITIKSKVDTQIRFTAQLLSGTFFLLDGIANQFHGTENARYFVYELYNKYNTTIVLHNKNGFNKFYGKVVEANDYWNGKESMPTQKDNLISSNNPFYYLYQISILTEIQIKENKCKQCLLLISVVPDTEGFSNEEKKKFTIQCTQQERFLKQRQQVVAFLSRRSIAFYDYYNTGNGTIVVSTSSQNQKCSVIYMKKGLEERASGSAFDKQSSSSNPNMLIYENAEAGPYSIAVQATDDCHYTISVSKNQNSLRSIEKGIYTDLNLQAQETIRFIYEHNSNETIRILTLHQNGELTVSAKAYKNTTEIINDNLQKVKFDWSGKDFLKIEDKSPGFCIDCSYLIVIQAQRNTKSSIMIPSKGSHFPIIMDATVKDQLNKGQVELLRIFTQRLTQFQINVGFGSIKLQIVGAHDKKVQFQATYNASKATIFQNVTSSKDGGVSPVNDYMFMQYSEIKIEALSNTAFRFGFVSSKDEQNRGSRVKYGVPEYISLVPKKTSCVRGTLTNSDQQFLISITGQKQEYEMQNLEISCTVDDKLLQLTKEIAKDEMIVKIERLPSLLPANYEFCMQFKQDLFLTFIHSAQLNYFPKDKSIFIRESMNLSFYAEGKSLIEINECTSRASTTISKNFNNLGQLNGDIKQVRKTNNIIEFTSYGPVYVHIQSKSSTALWRPKDELTRRGYGYDEYSTNKIRIEKLGNKQLKVDVYPLKKMVSKPTVNLQYVRYIGIIAEEEMNLYEAMNCKNGVYLQQMITTNNIDDEEKKIVLFFDVKNILDKFKDKKYVLVGVIAFAKSTIEGDSNYRFIYPYQEVLISTFHEEDGNLDKDKKPIEKEQKGQTSGGGFSTFVIYFTISVVLFFLLIWVYRKWLRGILNKRRRERLSEQGTGEVRYQQFTSYT